MNKKIIFPVAAILSLALLVGCGKKTTASSTTANAASQPASIVYEAEVEVKIDLSGSLTETAGTESTSTKANDESLPQPDSSTPASADSSSGG